MQLTVNAKGSFTADCQQAALAALGGSGSGDAELRRALLAAAEAELASKPTTLADDERLLQARCGRAQRALPGPAKMLRCMYDHAGHSTLPPPLHSFVPPFPLGTSLSPCRRRTS